MVLTIDKLNLQVAELEKEYNLLNTAGNLAVNVSRFINEYQNKLNEARIKIDIFHKQIMELVQEKQTLNKKEVKKENKEPTKQEVKK